MIEGVVGRADHLKKIRGVLFTPVSVEELLRGEFPEIGEFEILVEKKRRDGRDFSKIRAQGRNRRYIAAGNITATLRTVENQNQPTISSAAGR